ncbi:MAG TPA: sulfurtransferase [Burkholderiales bacterium]|nr:sulfurtransferase [Burkholderiales bacterium]
MVAKTLVSTAELAANLDRWRVFDCRHELLEPQLGESQYREAHIPGAVFASLDRDLSSPKSGKNGRHPLPDPNLFGAWLGRCGVNPTDPIVCYDAANGATAARLWWLARWIGHDAVAVLDGGLAKWTAEGRPVTAEVPHPTSATHPVHLRADMSVDVEAIAKTLRQRMLLDARAPIRYRGEQEPIDPVAGRIPGALNRFNIDNVRADGQFKSAAELKAEFQRVLGNRAPGEVVHYCGSGVAACHNLLALEVAGLPGGKLYAGSWSEWIAVPARPREKG